jgi:hypothetical protein
MGMWLPNLSSKSRRRSRRPARIPNPAPKLVQPKTEVPSTQKGETTNA